MILYPKPENFQTTGNQYVPGDRAFPTTTAIIPTCRFTTMPLVDPFPSSQAERCCTAINWAIWAVNGWDGNSDLFWKKFVGQDAAGISPGVRLDHAAQYHIYDYLNALVESDIDWTPGATR
jgi:hypothetical protein